MKLRIRSQKNGPTFTLLLPYGLAGAALTLTPNTAFRRAAAEIPPPYDVLVNKKTIRLFYETFKDIHKSWKGLEILRVETEDGLFISFTL